MAVYNRPHSERIQDFSRTDIEDKTAVVSKRIDPLTVRIEQRQSGHLTMKTARVKRHPANHPLPIRGPVQSMQFLKGTSECDRNPPGQTV